MQVKFKSILVILIVSASFSISAVVYSNNKNDVHVVPYTKSGKWVPEYGGASVPFRCYCTSHFFRSQCVVGDYTSNLSLCE